MLTDNLSQIIKKCWPGFQQLKNLPTTVTPSIPILWFGDLEAYSKSPLKILTVATNPSRKEFSIDGDQPYSIGLRFKGADAFADKKELAATDVFTYYEVMNGYFRRRPYWQWFHWFERPLNRLDASFKGQRANTAVHIDICTPVATIESWSELGRFQTPYLQLGWCFRKLLKAFAPDVILASDNLASIQATFGADIVVWGDGIIDKRWENNAVLILGRKGQTPFMAQNELLDTRMPEIRRKYRLDERHNQRPEGGNVEAHIPAAAAVMLQEERNNQHPHAGNRYPLDEFEEFLRKQGLIYGTVYTYTSQVRSEINRMSEDGEQINTLADLRTHLNHMYNARYVQAWNQYIRFGQSKDEAIGAELRNACLDGNTERVVSLLQAGADVNAEDEDGRTALMLVCREGHAECVEHLLKVGADVNTKDQDGVTALMRSCGCWQSACVNALLKAGADVDAKDNEGKTALMWACEKRRPKCVEALLKAGADVNAKDKDNVTALMRACSQDSTECGELLLKFGADVDAKDKEGKTALMRACRKGKTSFVEALLKAGADAKTKDNRGRTSYMYVVLDLHEAWDEKTACLKALLQADEAKRIAWQNESRDTDLQALIEQNLDSFDADDMDYLDE